MDLSAIPTGGMYRAELRARTHDVHQQLHLHSNFVALFDGTIRLPQYTELLQRFHGFYEPLESAIDAALERTSTLSAGFTYAHRTALLERDLANLGFTAGQIAQNPRCASVAKSVTPDTVAGVLYVIEGSTLGASLIDRAAQKILPDSATHGRNFWAWSRAHNTQRWAAINAYLDHLERSGHPLDAIVFGAQNTFTALANWLEPLEGLALSYEGVQG